MYSTAVVTFIYPKVVRYLDQFSETLKAQTNQHFTLLIFNDGVESQHLDSFLKKLNTEYVLINVSGDPVKIRFIALEYLRKSGFENVIFQDSDDLMGTNRIEVIEKHLSSHPLVVNDLDIANDEGVVYYPAIWGASFEKRSDFSFLDILKFNFAGLSNTSIRCSVLHDISFKTDSFLQAADWYIFFLILYTKNIKGYFTKDTRTIYRQHESNFVGIDHNNGQERQEINQSVRQQQFTALKGKIGETEFARLEKLYGEFTPLKSFDNPFWWEQKEIIN